MTLSADLLLALLTIALLSGGIFVAGMRAGRGAAAMTLAVLATLTLVVYAVWLNQSPILTRVLPLADVLLWGDVQLPAAALLAGVAWSSLRSPIWQRVLIVCVLLGIGGWRESEPLIGVPPRIGPARWTQQVCRQSSTSSCSAAAAATLLAAYGIPSSEAEMIQDCLTHVGGTTTLGLYRGLKLRTAGTMWSARAEDCGMKQFDRLPLPAIVTVRMAGPQPLLGSVGHSIVIFGRNPDGRFDVGDPFTGRQTWTHAQLAAVFGGEAFYLVRR